MFFKYGKNNLYIILFLYFEINNSIYLPSGINSLNKFLYLSRISKYYNQSKIGTCSLSDGPNCFYTENSYTNDYLKTIKENKDNRINNEWIQFHSKIQNITYKNILQNLSKFSLNYINSYSKMSDDDQNPKTQELNILMTFDDSTTKKGMYLEKLTNIFYNEKLIADFKGKLRLSKDDDIEKSKNSKTFHNYPSNLYGIIESEFVSISFRGKTFMCNYCYIRVHNPDNKKEEIEFYGYLGGKVVYGYSYSYTDEKNEDEKWILVNFPEKIVVDKLVIMGKYDIDNISFTFKYETSTDSNEIYYLYNYKEKVDLVDNEDI